MQTQSVIVRANIPKVGLREILRGQLDLDPLPAVLMHDWENHLPPCPSSRCVSLSSRCGHVFVQFQLVWKADIQTDSDQRSSTAKLRSGFLQKKPNLLALKLDGAAKSPWSHALQDPSKMQTYGIVRCGVRGRAVRCVNNSARRARAWPP
jgi:hypothetical protein